jgi:hypothetical protein
MTRSCLSPVFMSVIEISDMKVGYQLSYLCMSSSVGVCMEAFIELKKNTYHAGSVAVEGRYLYPCSRRWHRDTNLVVGADPDYHTSLGLAIRERNGSDIFPFFCVRHSIFQLC